MRTLKVCLNAQDADPIYLTNQPIVLEYPYPDSSHFELSGGRVDSISLDGWLPLLIEIDVNEGSGGRKFYFAYNTTSYYYTQLNNPSVSYDVIVEEGDQGVIDIRLENATNEQLDNAFVYNCVLKCGLSGLLTLNNNVLAFGNSEALRSPGLIYGDNYKHLYTMATPLDPEPQTASITITTDHLTLSEEVSQEAAGQLATQWVLGRYYCSTDHNDYDPVNILADENLNVLTNGTNALSSDTPSIHYSDNHLIWDTRHFALIFNTYDYGQDIEYWYTPHQGRWGSGVDHEMTTGQLECNSSCCAAFAITWAPWRYWNGSDFVI